MKDVRNKIDLAPLRQFFFHHGHVHVPNLPQYEELYDLCTRIRTSREQLPASVRKELDSMGFLWDLNISNELRWHYHYAELKQFYAQFGHTLVPAKKGEHKSLGAWVQRQRHRADKLTPEQKAALNKIKFLWSEDIEERKKEYWLSMFKKLKAFYKKYGHSNVPDRYKGNEKLGRWVSTIRYSEQGLAKWKKDLLKTVRFKYSEDIKRDQVARRKSLFSQLHAFYRIHGHANVPETYKDHKLAIFVGYLRQRPERIKPDEKKQLKKWNFLFSQDISEERQKLWDRHFGELQKFKKKYGHCRVSSAFENQPLARWVAKQRREKKKGVLPLHREKKLKQIGFSFYEDIAQLQEKKWKSMYEKLIAFKKRYGTTAVSENYKDPRLVNWVWFQRKVKERMSPERRKLLNKIGFIWRVR